MKCKRAVVNKKAVWIGDWRRRHMQLDAAQGILSFSTINNELRSVTHLGKNIQVSTNSADSTGRQLCIIDNGSSMVLEFGSVTAKMEWLKYLRDVIDARAVEESAGSTEGWYA